MVDLFVVMLLYFSFGALIAELRMEIGDIHWVERGNWIIFWPITVLVFGLCLMFDRVLK